MNQDASYFFCGIGGSGMLPLALIVQAQGGRIEGSDRALDQGRTPEKFDWLRAHGVTLHPQDGSGVTRPDQIVVATGAVEDAVPDIGAARRVGAAIKTRPELLSELFNAADVSVGVAGTSGKSTITGMIAWILHQTGRDPTVMNGAVMKNFADADHPFASALIGGSDLFVSEVDESDGSIARYVPTVAVVSNISLDHKSMEELRDLFGGFVQRAATAVLNLDNPETAALAQELPPGKAITFALGEEAADLSAHDLQPQPTGMRFRLIEGWSEFDVRLNVPGAHNVANALAALGAVKALGVSTAEAVKALGPRWVLVKGGHLPDNADAVDLLSDGDEVHQIASRRSASTDTHGTGCTLSSAIAANLARGADVPTAVRDAKTYISGAIEGGLRVGRGIGPVDHGWRRR